MDIMETENSGKKAILKISDIEEFYYRSLDVLCLLQTIIDAMEYVSDVEKHIKLSTYIARDKADNLTDDLKNLMNKLEVNVNKIQENNEVV